MTIPGGGGTNWLPPSFSPETGLFYVNATRGYSLVYLTDTDERPEGYGGSARGLWSEHVLEASITRPAMWSGIIRIRRRWPRSGGPGILTTAGSLLFTGDYAGNLIAYAPKDGTILWHFPMIHSLSNGPETYLLADKQYLVVGAGDTLFAFALLDSHE